MKTQLIKPSTIILIWYQKLIQPLILLKIKKSWLKEHLRQVILVQSLSTKEQSINKNPIQCNKVVYKLKHQDQWKIVAVAPF